MKKKKEIREVHLILKDQEYLSVEMFIKLNKVIIQIVTEEIVLI